MSKFVKSLHKQRRAGTKNLAPGPALLTQPCEKPQRLLGALLTQPSRCAQSGFSGFGQVLVYEAYCH
jgi:hypothetical protein